MSWYRGVIVQNKPYQFTLFDVDYGEWLTDRPTPNIELQDGRVLSVTGTEPNGSGGLFVRVDPPHNMKKPAEVWFQLTDKPVGAANTGALAAAYPAMPDGSAGPVAEGRREAAPAVAAPTGTGAYPALPDDDLLGNPMPLAVGPATGGAYPKLPSDDDDGSPINSHPGGNTFTRTPLQTSIDWNAKEKLVGGGCCPNGVKRALSSIIIIVLTTALLYGNYKMCELIGRRGPWLAVLAWTILGNLACAVILTGLFTKLHMLFNETSFGNFSDGVNTLAIITGVLLVVWVNACGIPLAMYTAQDVAAAQYLNPSMWKYANCWREPNLDFAPNQAHFVFLEEPQWYVDYKDRRFQKTWTLQGQDDDGSLNKKFWNYCIAPLRYTGAVPCNINFWAVCYRYTTNNAAASCNDADAANCGWQQPPTGVALRVLNENEMFFRAADKEDISAWNNALALAGSSPSGQSRNILVGYGWETPDVIQDYQTKARGQKLAVSIAMMVGFPVLTLIIHMWYYICGDGGRNCDCD